MATQGAYYSEQPSNSGQQDQGASPNQGYHTHPQGYIAQPLAYTSQPQQHTGQVYVGQPQVYIMQPQGTQGTQPQVYIAHSQGIHPQAVQPQVYAGQPQVYAGQPQVYAGQPQVYIAQPQGSQSQVYTAQPQAYIAQPQAYIAQPQGNQPEAIELQSFVAQNEEKTPQKPQHTPPGNYSETLITMKQPSFKCNDPFFAILFLLGMIATFVVGGIYISKWLDSIRQFTSYSLNIDSNITNACIVSSALGIFFGVVILLMVRCLNGHAVKTSLTMMILLCIAGAVLMAFKSFQALMIFFIVFAVISALYFLCVCRRIPFAEASVHSSVKGIFTFYGIIPVALLCSSLMFGFSIFWVHALNAIIYTLEVESLQEKYTLAPMGTICTVYVLYSLAYFWITETIRNITHTTTAGAIGTWWYVGSKAKGVTFGAFRRAITSSFGSIALGSLIVSLIQTLRIVVRIFCGRCSIIGCCFNCILKLVEKAFRFFNTYAYTYVALYGTTYVESGKSVTDLFISSALTTIINDDLTWTVININSFIAAALSAVICGYSFGYTETNVTFYVTVIISFLLSYFLCSSVLTTVASAVNSTFVVWAEDPAAMQATQPESFQRIADARLRFYK